jgi:hypothetical protein
VTLICRLPTPRSFKGEPSHAHHLPKILAALAFLSSAAPAFADNANVGVFAEGSVCARFAARDFLVNLIIEVGKGEVARPGRPS